MQERKNVRRLILLVVLTAVAGGIYFFQRREDRPLADPDLFRVNELSSIDNVLLESAAGKVKLSYESGRWKVNDHFEADRQRITVFFATIEKSVPKHPIAAGQKDSVHAALNERGVKVSLYAGSQLKKQFTAGGNLQKTESWFRKDKNSEAYRVTIPGYRVYVSQVFELPENEWRDKRIFDFNWENFKSLKGAFPTEATSDFTIEKNEGVFTIKEDASADTAKMFTYLDNVSYLVADQIVSPGTSSRYDSLAKTQPVASIEVSDIAGRTYSLKLFQPLKGESMVLGQDTIHGLVLFEMSRVYKAVRKRAYFKASNP